MRFLAVLTLFLALAAPAAAAGNATHDPRVPALQRQIAALQRQVNSLSSQVASARSAAGEALSASSSLASSLSKNTALDACAFALTYDSIFLMMYNDDLIFQTLAGRRVYGPQSGFDDRGACASAGISRTPWTAHLRMSSPTMEALLRPAPVIPDLYAQQ